MWISPNSFWSNCIYKGAFYLFLPKISKGQNLNITSQKERRVVENYGFVKVLKGEQHNSGFWP